MIKYAPLTDEMEKINSKLSTIKKERTRIMATLTTFYHY